jgi:2-C-methyl-D-erythritol 4-phosphate cytidylyltransferase
MKKFAIITAAGTGERMQSSLPKQFLILSGKPVLIHTIKKFEGIVDEIMVTLPENYIDYWKKLCAEYDFHIPHTMVIGAGTRFESIKNALEKIKGEEALIAVHDGVRPMLSESLIKNIFAAAEKNGNAVPFIPLSESIRSLDGDKNVYADRKKFISIQTPQCFRWSSLRKAYSQKFSEIFTDDATAVESATGEKIFLVEGEKENIKITTGTDLDYCESVVEKITFHP